jgi:hypothetical protein
VKTRKFSAISHDVTVDENIFNEPAAPKSSVPPPARRQPVICETRLRQKYIRIP